MCGEPIETTLYSFSEEAPAPASERRAGERHRTLFRVGTLLTDSQRELCVIRNVSAGGLSIRFYSPLSAGERVTVELKNGQPVSGVIGWVKGDQAGLQSDQPIDVAALLTNDARDSRPRMPRIRTDVIARVRLGACSHRVQVRDISQGGLKVNLDTAMSPKDQVIVLLPGLPATPGVVSWVAEDGAGISFNSPIALDDLVAWLRMQKQLKAAA